MAKPAVSAPPPAPKPNHAPPPAKAAAKAAPLPPRPAPPTTIRAIPPAPIGAAPPPAPPAAARPVPPPAPDMSAVQKELASLKEEHVKLQRMLSAAKLGPAPRSMTDIYDREQPALFDPEDPRIPILAWAEGQARANGPLVIPPYEYNDAGNAIVMKRSGPKMACYMAIPHDADPPSAGSRAKRGEGAEFRATGYIAIHSAPDVQGRMTRLDYITVDEAYALLYPPAPVAEQPGLATATVAELSAPSAPVEEQPTLGADGVYRMSDGSYFDATSQTWLAAPTAPPPAPVAPPRRAKRA